MGAARSTRSRYSGLGCGRSRGTRRAAPTVVTRADHPDAVLADDHPERPAESCRPGRCHQLIATPGTVGYRAIVTLAPAEVAEHADDRGISPPVDHRLGCCVRV